MGLFFSRTSRTRSRVRVRACPRTARSRVRVRVTVRARAARSRVRVRVCASYVFLPSFPWRASGSVHDGRRPLFSRVHVPPVHGSVYVCVPRTWFCPVFHGARPVPSTTGVGHFFPVSTYRPFTGPCTSVCLVRVFAQFSMARVRFRPRRASAIFSSCPRTARSRVRVRVCASYVVLPSFPWRASTSVHDGRRPLFSCVPVYESLYVVLPNFPWCASSSVHHSCPCLL